MITSAIKGSVELLKALRIALSPVYDRLEAENISVLVIEYFFEISKTQILMDAPFTTLDNEIIDDLNECISRLLKNEPIQHILGETEFFGLSFYVNEFVLIPRPETEELVYWILKDKEGVEQFRLLDLGTGSGCIPIVIKKERLKADINGLELSLEALSVAKDNAERNEVEVNWIQNNILDFTYDPSEKFDVIVSNPPYITNTEKEQMAKNVLDYDPELALFVTDDDPLLFYLKIADYANLHLKSEGILYFEINENFGAETTSMLEAKDFKEIVLRKDLNGKDRMIKAIKK
jgi:release factor glutamine methyltransferase